MPEVEIVESVEVFSADPKRVGKYDRWITYKTPDGRIDMVILPAETVTEAAITAAIRTKETERAKLVGKKITI